MEYILHDRTKPASGAHYRTLQRRAQYAFTLPPNELWANGRERASESDTHTAPQNSTNTQELLSIIHDARSWSCYTIARTSSADGCCLLPPKTNIILAIRRVLCEPVWERHHADLSDNDIAARGRGMIALSCIFVVVVVASARKTEIKRE